MQTLWLNDWVDSDLSQLERLFGLSKDKLKNIDILLASYQQADDCAYAFILYSIDNRLYEINASHDSELDLLGQWQPEETSIEALLFRLHRGHLGSNDAGDDIFRSALSGILKRFMQ